MFPFLEVAGVFIPTYNLVLAVGILAGAMQLFFLARRKRVTLQFLAGNFFLLLFVTLFFSRLAEVLFHGYSLLELPFFWMKDGNFNFFGGVAGFIAVLAFLSRKFNENFFTWLDLILLPASLTLVFHHFGTFFAGSAYGTQTALPWGVTFTNPDAVGYSTIPIHPVQIYAALLVFGFFIAASLISKHTTMAGKAGIFLILTISLLYFFLDFLRADSAVVFGFFRASQYFALAFSIFAALLVIRMKRKIYETRGGEFHVS